jgi:hypothetical protein
LDELAPEVDEARGWRGFQHQVVRFRRRRRVVALTGSLLGLISVVGLIAVLSNPPTVEVAGPLPPATGSYPGFFYLSDFQKAILEDGVVTLDEMESALSSFTSCLRDAGIDVTGEVDPSGSYSLAVRTPAGSSDREPFDDPAYEPCLLEYFNSVGQVWVDQAYSPEDDQAFYEHVVTCLRELGLPVEDSRPSTLSTWIREEPVLYEQCLDEAASQFRER